MDTTTVFALLSTRLEVNRMKPAFTMAPLVFMTRVRSPIKTLTSFANNIEWIAKTSERTVYTSRGDIQVARKHMLQRKLLQLGDVS